MGVKANQNVKCTRSERQLTNYPRQYFFPMHKRHTHCRPTQRQKNIILNFLSTLSHNNQSQPPKGCTYFSNNTKLNRIYLLFPQASIVNPQNGRRILFFVFYFPINLFSIITCLFCLINSIPPTPFVYLIHRSSKNHHNLQEPHTIRIIDF